MNKPVFFSILIVLIIIFASISYFSDRDEVPSDTMVPEKPKNRPTKQYKLSTIPNSDIIEIHDSLNEEWRKIYNKAVQLWQREEFEEASEKIYQSVSLVEKKYGNEHLYIVDPLYLKAMISLKQDKIDTAEAIFRQIIAIHQKLPSVNPLKFVAPLMRLADLESEREDYTKAEEYTNQIISYLTENTGVDNTVLINFYSDLVYYSYSKGEYKLAKECYNKLSDFVLDVAESLIYSIPDSSVGALRRNNFISGQYATLLLISIMLGENDDTAKWRNKMDEIQFLIDEEKDYAWSKYGYSYIDSIKIVFDYMQKCADPVCVHINTKFSEKPYKFSVEYTGSFRPTKEPSKILLQAIGKMDLIPNQFIEQYQDEMLVKNENGEYWMPVPPLVADIFKYDKQPGDIVDILVFFPGAFYDQDILWWIFMIIELK